MKDLLFFYGLECPHCIPMEVIVDKLISEGVNIKKVEIWHNKENDKMMPVSRKFLGCRHMVPDFLRVFKKENISFKLVSTIIDKESEWNPNGINHNKNGTTDYGLMQLNNSNKYMFEKYFWDRKEKFDIKNPEHNATVGIKFFKSLLKQYHNDIKKALTAYNAGSAAVTYDNPPESTIHYRSSIIKKFQS